jgi:alkanesulfonate monooxygenase SsuD/methylene tetrahydromethanopterin reductase-like flavin-dependent oxidoreductase (luciferase family)
MRYAMDIPNFGPFADLEATMDLARDAEAAGWDAVWVWDHMLRDRDVPYADPWILLAAIAISTSRIRLGPMVTPLPRRRPWTVAREAVTLDHLSGGRFTLGVGLGNPPREFAAVGDEADPKVRAARLDEGLEIIERCWTGETFSFHGEHYNLEDVEFLPVPLQQPRIPVIVAATWPVRAPFRRAVRWDGVWPLRRNPDGTSSMLTPGDVRGIRDLVGELRESPEPFDVMVAGSTIGLPPAEAAATARSFADAGATWWTERINLGNGSYLELRDRIRLGPPRL